MSRCIYMAMQRTQQFPKIHSRKHIIEPGCQIVECPSCPCVALCSKEGTFFQGSFQTCQESSVGKCCVWRLQFPCNVLGSFLRHLCYFWCIRHAGEPRLSQTIQVFQQSWHIQTEQLILQSDFNTLTNTYENGTLICQPSRILKTNSTSHASFSSTHHTHSYNPGMVHKMPRQLLVS